CLAETIGYICCSPDNTDLYYQDEYGDWGIDFEKNEWCGITPYVKECWSKELGYNCCNGCNVIEIDNDGKWGVENDEWCGI
ncbi:Non-catalytic module family DOC2, partial [Piromyces sp. E2]